MHFPGSGTEYLECLGKPNMHRKENENKAGY